MAKVKILMVCLGNICRSPLAEGILQSKLSPENFTVDSAGTASYHIGKLPDPKSIAVAKKNNIDITHQRCRQFTKNDFDVFDYIYAMDVSNYKNIIRLAESEDQKAKVRLILNEVDTLSNSEVPDPYYGGDDGFDTVFTMLDMACTTIADKLQQESH